MEEMTAEERARLGAKNILKVVNQIKTVEGMDEIERRLKATRKEIGYLLMYIDVKRETLKIKS